MYLEHFGLVEPPFKITPVTDFFFSGANRGEILEAIVYAITDGEGIVKISGEVGSGKTMLCRMLLDKLPTNIKAIYLANPSMSRDELLYAIADRLDLDMEGKRVNVILQTLQNHLEAMYERGERCVVLVDEAHAMPLETLEELRLLYNLQVGKHKLLQIVLFGQPELDAKLDQTNMRQLKDRIVHHFTILPLSPKIIHAYLMFRMRAAGYKGPDIFDPAAEKMIGKASHGLMRRVNILADKALLAAFVENTHSIDVRHVQAAIRDSEMTPMHRLFNQRNISMVGGAALLTLILAGAAWFFIVEKNEQSKTERSMQMAAITPTPAADLNNTTLAAPTIVATSAPVLTMTLSTAPVVTASSPVATSPTPENTKPDIANIDAPSPSGATPHRKSPSIIKTPAKPVPPAANPSDLLEQRLEATRTMLRSSTLGNASIQLFYTENTQIERMEGFLRRASKLGKLQEIYILPITLNGRDAYRVLYGIYPNSDAARIGMSQLPARYLDAFAPTLHLLDNSQNLP